MTDSLAVVLEPGPWTDLGHAGWDLGDGERALAALERAIELDPEDDSPQYDLANMLRKLGKLQPALRRIERVLESSPDDAAASHVKAKILKGLADTEATHWFGRALDLYGQEARTNGDAPATLLQIACVHVGLGDAEHALDLLDRAVAADPLLADDMRSDADLQPLKNDPRFTQLVSFPASAITEQERARKNGLAAAVTVEKVLRRMGWTPQETDEEATFHVDLTSHHIPLSHALAKVKLDTERFVFLLVFRDHISSQEQPEVLEFVTRANFELIIGNFEFDYEACAVRFKSAIDFSHVELLELLVRNAILCAVDVAEAYGNQLVAVIQGEKRARTAIADAEAAIES